MRWLPWAAESGNGVFGVGVNAGALCTDHGQWSEKEMKVQQMSLIERRMKFMPCTVGPSDSVAYARALLDERRINHLPVLSRGRLVGIVTCRDLRAGAASASALQSIRHLRFTRTA